MGDIDLDIEVKRAKRVGPALRRGIEKGLEDAGNYLLDSGKERSVDIITGTRKIWNKEVKRGFVTEENEFNRWNHWKGDIINPVKHADVVDRGLAPKGEITGSTPSVQDLMPWVVDNLSPADYEGGDGEPPFDPGDGGDDDGGGEQPAAITESDRTVQFGALDDLGLRADSFESEHVKAGTVGDGTNVVWKSHNTATNTPQDWKQGIVRNEVVWSKAAEDAGFDIGPLSRIETTETSSGETGGTLQEYVPGSQLKEEVFSGFGSPSDYQYRRDEFLKENKEWAAQTNAIDYLIGNDDRHMNNVRLTPDGEPRNIDSGGNQFNEDLEGQNLNLFSDLLGYDTANRDALYTQNQAMLDETEAILDRIADDEDYRNALIATVAAIHGEGSREHDRIIKILGETVGDGHMLETDDRNIPRYKLDIQNVRDRHDRVYNGGEGFLMEDDITVMGPDDTSSTAEEDAILSDDEEDELKQGIENELNKLLGDDDNEE